jgi:hypothetical protein
MTASAQRKRDFTGTPSPLVMAEAMTATHRYAMVVGPAASYGWTAAEVGGRPPAKVLIFPAGKWVLADGELITDAAALRDIVSNYRARGIRIVFDYEHMTLDEFRKPGELPIAAGWITALEITEEGLVGSVEWTEKAAQMIAAGEYVYHSPVAIYDKATLRVFALHSCALTNTPRTNNQKLITEQVAAKVIVACLGGDEMEGGYRMQWIDLLMQFLSGRYDSTPAQKIEMLHALINALEAVDNAEGTVAATAPEPETILAALRLVPANEVAAVPADVIAALALGDEATTSAVVARIAEMKTGVIAIAEHDAAIASVRADLTTARESVTSLTEKLAAAERGNEVESLITANLTRLSPALRENIRAVAKTDHALAVTMIANITGGAAASTAATLPERIATDEPHIAAEAEGEARMWRGQMLEASESSSVIAAAVRTIQKTEHCDYVEASRRYHQRNRAA